MTIRIILTAAICAVAASAAQAQQYGWVMDPYSPSGWSYVPYDMPYPVDPFAGAGMIDPYGYADGAFPAQDQADLQMIQDYNAWSNDLWSQTQAESSASAAERSSAINDLL